jgi:superfamily I DNA/RNA helicase
MKLSRILYGLNDSQKRAATTTEGPLLIIAGPGTGKTLTIVDRIAYLVQQGVAQENILAVTFTNRAAKEMLERTENILGADSRGMFIGTFHLLGLKILRDALPDGFTVCDREEQMSILRTLAKNSGMKARGIADAISKAKNFIEDVDNEIRDIYERYQSELKKNSAFDFDDLILKPIEILSGGDLSEKYRKRFSYIIVDEYQDINPAQFMLLRLLSDSNGNVCAVGDSDQAIYAFRGADIENFLNFERDFEGAAKLFLTENYRSTGIILGASSGLIKNNSKRINRGINAVREKGTRINIISAPTEKAEGEAIVREIEKRMGGTSHYQMMHTYTDRVLTDQSYCFSDFAVIFRTNAQAKAVEEAFIASGIPYQAIGSRKSLQSKAIGETLEYLSSLIDSEDREASCLQDSVETALLTPADFYDPSANAVTLMTMHMAKGLEFRVVFIAGVEDGLIPFTLHRDDADIEEERRLFYVGMTRARDELFLLHARNRFLYGERLSPSPSPFLGEIPEEFIQKKVIPDRVKKPKEDSQMGLF